MHKKLAELGLRRDKSQNSIVYTQRFERTPNKHANLRWDVDEVDLEPVSRCCRRACLPTESESESKETY